MTSYELGLTFAGAWQTGLAIGRGDVPGALLGMFFTGLGGLGTRAGFRGVIGTPPTRAVSVAARLDRYAAHARASYAARPFQRTIAGPGAVFVQDVAGPGAVFRQDVGFGVAPAPTGQIHHPISTRVGRALENHETLRGHFQPRDPRFTTRAIDEAAHRGYQRWHRELDAEIEQWIRDPRNESATPQQFLDMLRSRYSEPDLRRRFPNGF